MTIADRGQPNRERLHISVLAEANLIYYVVFDTVSAPGGLIIANPKRAYWFTDHPVRAGDNVLLYTGHGANTVNVRPDGGTNHFFYWGSSQVLWGHPSARVVLLELSSWETFPG